MIDISNKPSLCCHPDCYNCPYADCIYEQLEIEDFISVDEHEKSVQSEIKLFSGYVRKSRRPRGQSGRKYYDLHDYNQKYYKENAESIKEFKRLTYDREENAKKCKKYAENNKEHLKEYHKSYYQRNKERLKAKAKENYHKKKGA